MWYLLSREQRRRHSHHMKHGPGHRFSCGHNATSSAPDRPRLDSHIVDWGTLSQEEPQYRGHHKDSYYFHPPDLEHLDWSDDESDYEFRISNHSDTEEVESNNNTVNELHDFVIISPVVSINKILRMTVHGLQEVNEEDNMHASTFTSHVDTNSLSFESYHSHESANSAAWEELNGYLRTGSIKEAKQLLRSCEWSVNSPVRVNLWKELCRFHSREKDFSDNYYWDTVTQIYGTKDLDDTVLSLPNFLSSQSVVVHSLSLVGSKVCQRILSVISFSHPAITYAPTLYAVASLFLHYMDEPTVYNCLSALISSQNKFITQTKVSYESTWRTVIVLAKKHLRGSFSTLQKLHVAVAQIEEAFQNWIWWIFSYLPLSYQIRITDCFLLEGAKVLMRVALSLFRHFIKSVQRDSNMARSLSSKGILDPLTKFCQEIKISPRKMLKTGFAIRGFSKVEIRKIVMNTEMMIKSKKNAESGVTKSYSFEGVPTSHSQQEVQMMSHTLAIKEGQSSPSHRVDAMVLFPIQNIKSQIVNRDELIQIWSWLPTRITMYQPMLVYTTDEHGCSLTTFFQRVEKHEPTVMVIRSTDDCIFGAYLSSSWGTRKVRDEYGNRQTYFGTGETFLFTLRPKIKKYQWVGITLQQQDSAVRCIEHTSELFMHADSTSLAIGGGEGHGLMLDEELHYGKTETCRTFDNEPLCSEKDFEIKVLEVYAFATS